MPLANTLTITDGGANTVDVQKINQDAGGSEWYHRNSATGDEYRFSLQRRAINPRVGRAVDRHSIRFAITRYDADGVATNFTSFISVDSPKGTPDADVLWALKGLATSADSMAADIVAGLT